MYKCNICGKEYSKIESLQNHLTRFHKFTFEDIKKYYEDNYKKEGDGIDPITGNPTEFISMCRGYKKYEQNNPKKFATNTVEHYMSRGLSREEAEKRIEHVKSISSNICKTMWKKVKEEGKTRGGWSKKHFMELGYSEQDAEIEVKKRAESREQKMKKSRKKHKESGEYKKFSNCCIEFYLEKGMSQEDALNALKERQATNTLNTYIKKYGEIDGPKMFMKRNEKWSEDMENRYRNGEYSRNPDNKGNGTYCRFTSIIEKEFCSGLITRMRELGIDENKIYSTLTKNSQYCIFHNGRRYFYDFVFIDGHIRKIIEFNGDFWHMNPSLHNADDINSVLNKTAKELWDDFEEKRFVAENEQNFEVYVVWENDWNKNKYEVFDNCLNFLLNGKNT